MIEPPLDEAIGALRDEESLAPGDALGTRSRVLATLGRRRQQRQVWLVAGMVVACSLVGTTSWAWVTGWLPARLGLAVEPVPSGGPAGERRPTAGSAHALAGAAPRASEPAEAGAAGRIADAPAPSAPSLPSLPGSPDSPGSPEIAPAAPSAPAKERPASNRPGTERVTPPAAVRSRPRPSAPALTAGPTAPSPRTIEDSASAQTPPAEAPAPDPELAAFRRAHEAHFGGGQPLAVLALWDDYLARFAAGRLSPEARWNRAVLLARLGRASEARAALAPFAAGAEGGYRQREAEELLRTLP